VQKRENIFALQSPKHCTPNADATNGKDICGAAALTLS
jgi:hypothetical protein